MRVGKRDLDGVSLHGLDLEHARFRDRRKEQFGCENHFGSCLGRTVVAFSFHHFADYNWDFEKGCPSFVTEPPGDAVRKYPARLGDVKAYVRTSRSGSNQPRVSRSTSTSDLLNTRPPST